MIDAAPDTSDAARRTHLMCVLQPKDVCVHTEEVVAAFQLYGLRRVDIYFSTFLRAHV